MWVLWVPLEDEKVTTDYSDRAVAQESSITEKNPTERKIQEFQFKEKKDQLWDWEDEKPSFAGSTWGSSSHEERKIQEFKEMVSDLMHLQRIKVVLILLDWTGGNFAQLQRCWPQTYI